MIRIKKLQKRPGFACLTSSGLSLYEWMRVGYRKLFIETSDASKLTGIRVLSFQITVSILLAFTSKDASRDKQIHYKYWFYKSDVELSFITFENFKL